uniref:LRRCT domain-containing protein n=1 Tax=Anopheles atroparvus TaxID=41427 RepID=A0A182IT44_ANOAO
MWTRVNLPLVVFVLAATAPAALRCQEDVEPVVDVTLQPPVSHLCHFEKPLLDPTDTDDDQFCDCDVHNAPPWGLPEVQIDCRKHQIGDDFWQGYEQLPQGTIRLDLSRNALTAVPQLVGDKLRYLRLSQNQITTIPDRVFANLSALHELDLSGNRIEIIGTDALAGLAMIKQIDLSDNLIRTIEVNAFSQFIHLERLILSNNSLGEFFNRTEADLYLRLGVTTRLSSLEMERCNLSDINLGSGVGLQRVLLGHNRLQQLARLPKQLSYLDLSGTPIRSLPAKFLPQLLHLETLILQDMPILYTLEEYALYGLPRLTMLNLQGSRNLSNIHPYLFGQNVVRNESGIALKRLILKGTNIRTLNSSLEVPLENLSLLDIRGAPLRCDCELRWLRELPNVKTLGACVKPSALRGKMFGTVDPHDFQCRAEQSWVYIVFNVVLAVVLLILVAVGIFLIIRAIRPKPHVQLRRVGAASPYARVTIEPNQAEVL